MDKLRNDKKNLIKINRMYAKEMKENKCILIFFRFFKWRWWLLWLTLRLSYKKMNNKIL